MSSASRVTKLAPKVSLVFCSYFPPYVIIPFITDFHWYYYF